MIRKFIIAGSTFMLCANGMTEKFDIEAEQAKIRTEYATKITYIADVLHESKQENIIKHIENYLTMYEAALALSSYKNLKAKMQTRLSQTQETNK